MHRQDSKTPPAFLFLLTPSPPHHLSSQMVVPSAQPNADLSMSFLLFTVCEGGKLLITAPSGISLTTRPATVLNYSVMSNCF